VHRSVFSELAEKLTVHADDFSDVAEVASVRGSCFSESAENLGGWYAFALNLASSAILPRERECAAPARATSMSRKRVLIVDDDPAIRQIVRVLLERDGVSADIAEDGERATAMLRGGDYGVVLLDLLMPRLDGRGVIAYMREHQIDTPVIVISAVGEVASDLDPQLVRVVLQKPFEARDLRKVVTAVLEQM
jgi:CheY-like chemotaxis protein